MTHIRQFFVVLILVFFVLTAFAVPVISATSPEGPAWESLYRDWRPANGGYSNQLDFVSPGVNLLPSYFGISAIKDGTVWTVSVDQGVQVTAVTQEIEFAFHGFNSFPYAGSTVPVYIEASTGKSTPVILSGFAYQGNTHHLHIILQGSQAFQPGTYYFALQITLLQQRH